MNDTPKLKCGSCNEEVKGHPHTVKIDMTFDCYGTDTPPNGQPVIEELEVCSDCFLIGNMVDQCEYLKRQLGYLFSKYSYPDGTVIYPEQITVLREHLQGVINVLMDDD